MNGVVLYIDDNRDNILVVQRMLRHVRPDIELRTAETGADGTRAAIDSQPALILLDNRLPDGNGQQVLRSLAANPATAEIPVIILSGDSGDTTVKELLAAGAADFLAKPFDMQQLTEAIGRYLP
jgi:CheY-like chemotaxis protein